jgi:aspartate 1-decarboxylase
MLISVVKSKIHMATITDTQPDYQGSIGIDKDLIEGSGLIAGEKVHVLNANNANRFETYVIEGKKGEISLRGPAAKLGGKGDQVVIIAYGLVEQSEGNKVKPKIILVNKDNEIK